MAPKKKVNKKPSEDLENMLSAKDLLGAKLCEMISSDAKARDMFNELALGDETDKDEKSEVLELLELQRKAKMQLHTKMMLVEEGTYQNPAPYSDGDQTSLKGHRSIMLKHQWAGGMDYNPENPRFSQWMKALYFGDYNTMIKIIEETKEQDLEHLLEKRESLYNVSAIFHVIMGARVLYGERKELEERRKRFNNIKSDHMACFLKLLELGAKINAKDVAGNTPLHHCVTMFANDVTKRMAKILLKKGANVNEQNRFGATPLEEPTITGQLDVLELLVKYGADPSIPDNDGTTCLGFHKWGYPKIEEIFGKASYDNAKVKRREAKEEQGGCLWKCVGCSSIDKENKRCTGCYLVYYCGRPCQEKDWKNHKKTCKETSKKFVPVSITRYDQMASKHLKTGKVFLCKDTDVPSSSHFMVKIQVPVDNQVKGPLKVYNKDRSFWGFIPTTDATYEKLEGKIKEKGPLGAKGFFYATWKEGSGVKINATDIQTPETW